MKVLVTGGAGFVGTSLVQWLLGLGYEVRVLDRNPESLKGLASRYLELIPGVIEDAEVVQGAMRGMEVVYHLAESYLSEPLEVLETDVKGNLNLLNAAAGQGVKHFLFTSTTRVYGRPRYRPVDEAHPLLPEESGRPLYALAKLTNEKLCLLYQREHNLPVTIFRFWWAYGLEVGGRALRNLVDTALKGQTIRVPQGAGGSFAHNDDIAQAMALATLNPQAYGQAFNLSSGFYTTWRELAELICRLASSSSPLELIPPEAWAGDPTLGTDSNIPERWEIAFEKAERLLGYQPRYGPEEARGLLEEALARLVASRRGQ